MLQLSYPNACYLFANVYFDYKYQDKKIYSSKHHELGIVSCLSLSPQNNTEISVGNQPDDQGSSPPR